jgi:hypothetical protein
LTLLFFGMTFPFARWHTAGISATLRGLHR